MHEAVLLLIGIAQSCKQLAILSCCVGESQGWMHAAYGRGWLVAPLPHVDDAVIYLVLERWLCTSLVTNISVAMLDNRYACCTVSIQNANILEWQNSNGTQRRSWFWHYWIVLELLPDEDTYIKASVHWRKSEKLQHVTQAISPQVMSLSVANNSCFTRSKFALTLHWQWWITSGQSGSVD